MKSLSSQDENKKQESKAPARWTAIILAAGKGTRMNSPLPKVLHPAAGLPMISRVVQSCQQAGVMDIRIVVGHGQTLVRSVVEPLGVQTFVQNQQLGTADAVKSAQPETIEGHVLILNGDHPLIEASDIREFIKTFNEEKLDLAVVTAQLKFPGDFGRIIRQQGRLKAIVESKDASPDTLKINEVNTGIYLTTAEHLSEYLPNIKNENMKGEYYLTDLVSLSIDDSCKVDGIRGKKHVARGVNTQAELAQSTQYLFRRKIKRLLDSGVVILDPISVFVEDSVEVSSGAVLHSHIHIKGKSKIGSFTSIEPNCFIVDTEIGESAQIKANCYFEGSKIHNRAQLGPFARLRAETVIGEEAHVGNFVEMKKTVFGAKSKAGHLTYLGDAEVGEDTNIGCGTITCNYAVDRKKYKTKIGSKVFVGSDTQFVAPVEIGDGAVIASGSTITESVPAEGFAVARGRQYTKPSHKKS